MNMHNNEKAYVLVLEYIEGFTLRELSIAYGEEDPEHEGATAAWRRHLALYKKVVSKPTQCAVNSRLSTHSSQHAMWR